MSLNVGELVAFLRLDNSQFAQAADQSEGRFSRLGSTLASAAKVVGAAGIGAVAAAGTVGVKTAAQMEQASIGFTTMLGSAEKAQKFLGDLSSFAAKTPFEFPELQTAASSLVSAGIEASKVIPIMTSLGNATSGMGTGSEGVKRATVALQQMNAAGKITGEDLNQLRDAGIPVYDLLAAATGKSKEAVSELAQKGKLGRKELEQLMTALESGKGLERFTGLMEAQSQSLTGLWSTLKDTFSVGMADAIQPLVPIIKDGLGGAITFAAGLMPKISTALQGVADGYSAFEQGLIGNVSGDQGPGMVNKLAEAGNRARIVIAALTSGVHEFGAGWSVMNGADPEGSLGAIGQAGIKVHTALLQAKDAVTGLFPAKGTGDGIDWAATLDKAQAAGAKLWPSIKEAAASLQGLKPMIDVTGAAFGFMATHLDTIVQYMPLLIAAFVAYKTAQAAASVAAIFHLPLLAAQIASNYALAQANMALAIALGYQRTSTIASIAAWVAHAATMTVATVRVYAYVAGLYIQSAATAVATAATWAFGAAMTVATGPIGLVILAVAAFAAGLVLLYKNSETARNIINGVFDVIGKAVTAVWDNVLRPVLGFWIDKFLLVYSTILNGAASAFGWVPGLGDKLKGAASAFDRFRDDVNASLGGVQDKQATVTVSGKYTGLSNMAADGPASRASTLSTRRDGGSIPALASGGAVASVDPGGFVVNAASTRKYGPLLAAMGGGLLKGPGSGRSDSILGVDSKTGQPTAKVSNGEWYADPATAGAFGPMLAAINADKLANGGGVGVAPRVDSSALSTGLAGLMEEATARAVREATPLAQAAADRQAQQTVQAQQASAGGGSGVAGQGSDQIKSFIRSVDPLPYIWGAVGPRGYDCSGLVGEVLNRMIGRRSFSRAFTTASISAGQYGLKPGLGGTLDIGVTPGSGHMAGSYGGLGFEARSTATGIFTGPAAKAPSSFARKFHLANGGLVDQLAQAYDVAGDPGNLTLNDKPAKQMLPWGVYDGGGWLEPDHAAVNRGGRPEAVLTPEESAGLKAGLGLSSDGPRTMTGRLYLDSGEFLGMVRGVLDEDLDEMTAALTANRGA